MADRTEHLDVKLPVLWVDNGDGTWTPQMGLSDVPLTWSAPAGADAGADAGVTTAVAMDSSCTRVKAEDPKLIYRFKFLTASIIAWLIDITPMIPGTPTSSVPIQVMLSPQ